MKNPVTSSERKGVLIVAAIALAVTGAGAVVARCDRPDPMASQEDIISILYSDSVIGNESRRVESLNDDSTLPTSRGKQKKTKKQKSQKKQTSYPDRSPLDEPVPTGNPK